MTATVADSFVVSPGPGLILWTLLSLAIVAAGVVTVVKRRWGWFLVGLLLGGLPWLYAAVALPPAGRRRER